MILVKLKNRLKKVKVKINLGVIESFISEELTTRKEFPQTRKENLYKSIIINRN